MRNIFILFPELSRWIEKLKLKMFDGICGQIKINVMRL